MERPLAEQLEPRAMHGHVRQRDGPLRGRLVGLRLGRLEQRRATRDHLDVVELERLELRAMVEQPAERDVAVQLPDRDRSLAVDRLQLDALEREVAEHAAFERVDLGATEDRGELRLDLRADLVAPPIGVDGGHDDTHRDDGDEHDPDHEATHDAQHAPPASRPLAIVRQ